MKWDETAKRRAWQLHCNRWSYPKIAASMGRTETSIRKQLAKMMSDRRDPRNGTAPGPDDWPSQCDIVAKALGAFTRAGIRFEDAAEALATEGVAIRLSRRGRDDQSMVGNSSAMCAGLR